jgi:cell division protein FtsW (lipid II flippase)
VNAPIFRLFAIFVVLFAVLIGFTSRWSVFGATGLIPLTGVTLPFVSYGGSSIVANFILLALLLAVSNKARKPA